MTTYRFDETYITADTSKDWLIALNADVARMHKDDWELIDISCQQYYNQQYPRVGLLKYRKLENAA